MVVWGVCDRCTQGMEEHVICGMSLPPCGVCIMHVT